MTDQAADPDAIDDESGDIPPPSTKKWSGKRIVMFIILPLLVILSGGAAGAYYMGFLGGHKEKAVAEEAAKADEQKHVRSAVFVDVPDLLVNLNTDGRRTSFLKLKVALEVATDKDAPLAEQQMPRVVDTFQGYLRELRADDLRGSAGLYRLREDLLARAKTAAEPAVVTDVLFKEMLVQ